MLLSVGRVGVEAAAVNYEMSEPILVHRVTDIAYSQTFVYHEVTCVIRVMILSKQQLFSRKARRRMVGPRSPIY